MDRDSEATSEMVTTSSNRAYLRKVAEKIIGHQSWGVEHHWAGIMGFIGGKHIGGISVSIFRLSNGDRRGIWWNGGSIDSNRGLNDRA